MRITGTQKQNRRLAEVQCSAVQCSAVQCSAVQWSAVQWNVANKAPCANIYSHADNIRSSLFKASVPFKPMAKPMARQLNSGRLIHWIHWISRCVRKVTPTQTNRRQVSVVSCLVTPVTCHMSLTQTATATDPSPANSPTMHSRIICKDPKNLLFSVGQFRTISAPK